MKKRFRNSYGVAICRYNAKKNNTVEILMVKKRYTYHYFSFIFGFYKKYDNKYLEYLFDNMTFGEKVDILSLKFSTMWYRIWLCDPEKNYNMYKLDIESHNQNITSYYKKKDKFENIFMQDSGKRLYRLINNSTNSVTPWEIPKGNINLNETPLNCAIRELYEETNLCYDKYKILWNLDLVKSTIMDDNISYRSNYFIASLNNNSNWTPKVNFGLNTQMSEIEQIQWISLEEINFLNLNVRYKAKLLTLYKSIIKKFKGEVKSYYYD